MFSARHSAIPRCEKSRHTPVLCVTVSNAEVMEFVVPRRYSTLSWIESVIATTFSCGLSILPNKSHARRLSRSDWQ